MNVIDEKGLWLYQFGSFDPNIVGHAFFGRKAGVSPEPWSSLNQGGTVGDERVNVIENRIRAFAAINRSVESIFDVWQVHSSDIVITERPRPLDAEHQQADAIITTNPEVTLFMRFADCVPILLYEPEKKVAAIIHAGWQGTVKKIVEKTIILLAEKYKVDPKSIVAGIGPSIGPCHYQVGELVIDTVKKEFKEESEMLLINDNGKTYFDLWKANEIQLIKNGVGSIEVSRECTACHTEVWYSHRAEHGKTGRFGAAIYLKGG
jgi:polyphenol oxidase